MKVTLYDREIEVEKVGNFLIPTSFPDINEIKEWLPKLETLISSGTSGLLNTPWIVGSGTHDIDGNPRTSQSHSSQNAIDITPMWSETEVLDPDMSVPGLAWNIVSLLALASITDRGLSFVIESDHIHVSKNGQPDLLSQSSLIVANTLASCYPIKNKVKEVPFIEVLMGQLYAFQATHEGVSYAKVDKESISLFKQYVG
jgi:hypothetical protein